MTSLKKLIAVAAAALPLATLAQEAKPPPPAFQIYGTFNLNLQNTTAKGAFDKTKSMPSRMALGVDSSNIGIKGTADVDFGLQVVWQCESGAALDGAGTNSFCNRNSRLGLAHPVYGTLFYGNWDTPYKAQIYGTKADDPFGSTDVYGYNSLISNVGFKATSGTWNGATAAPTNMSFDLRANNSVAYWSPKIAGAWLRLQYSADEQASFTRDAPAGTGYALDPYLVSAALNYDAGPLSVSAAFERHYDGAGLMVLSGAFGKRGFTAPSAQSITTAPSTGYSPTTQDDAWRVAAGYELGNPFGTTTLSAMFEQITLKQDHPAQNSLKEYSRWAAGVGAKHRMGNHEFRGRYTMADKGTAKVGGPNPVPDTVKTDTTGYGANSWALGYSYYLAKSTQVYAYFVRIENEFRATYTPTVPTQSYATNMQAGADPQIYGLGLRYGF